MASELTPKQQWSELIKTANSILILTHSDPDGDALGSSLALRLVLEKLDKKVQVAASGKIPEYLNFLPGIDLIDNNYQTNHDILFIIDESQGKVGNVSLKRVADNKLMVVVSPKEGLFTTTDIRIEEGSPQIDLIISLDCVNIDRFGDFYENNSNLLYEVPVVNIDHHPGNTNFGKVNIVDITASSTAELMVSLIETLGKDHQGLIDADCATCLLTGLVTDTSSFQNGNTTPKSLTIAAQMVAAGAAQQEIVNRIYKSRSLSTLRLWGRALSYIKEDRNLQFAWSTLSKADFVASQADTSETSGVVDELLKTAGGMNFVLLLSERNGNIHASFRSIEPSCNVMEIANLFGGGGHVAASGFVLKNAKLENKEMEIIETIRNFLTGNINSPIDNIEEIKEPTNIIDELTDTKQELEIPKETGFSNK